jgi:hypothetical protein
MSLRSATKYWLWTRLALPLCLAYSAGFSAGQMLYYKTAHLGLFRGPLGELHKAYLGGTGPRSYASGTWMDWVMVATFVGILLIELRRLPGRRVRASGALLQFGYLLGALSSVAIVCLGRSRHWEVVSAVSVVMGLLLAAGAWPRWRAAVRALAVGLFLVGVVLSLWGARGRDLRELATPQRRLARLSHASPSVWADGDIENRSGIGFARCTPMSVCFSVRAPLPSGTAAPRQSGVAPGWSRCG